MDSLYVNLTRSSTFFTAVASLRQADPQQGWYENGRAAHQATRENLKKNTDGLVALGKGGKD